MYLVKAFTVKYLCSCICNSFFHPEKQSLSIVKDKDMFLL
jgi:hypothetical protein